MLSTLQILNHLAIITTLRGRFYYPYLIDEEVIEMLNKLTRNTQQSWVMNTAKSGSRVTQEYLEIQKYNSRNGEKGIENVEIYKAIFEDKIDQK